MFIKLEEYLPFETVNDLFDVFSAKATKPILEITTDVITNFKNQVNGEKERRNTADIEALNIVYNQLSEDESFPLTWFHFFTDKKEDDTVFERLTVFASKTKSGISIILISATGDKDKLVKVQTRYKGEEIGLLEEDHILDVSKRVYRDTDISFGDLDHIVDGVTYIY